MKKSLFIFWLLSISYNFLTAQSQFQYMVSGITGEAYSIIQTTDGGYAVAGGANGLSTGHGDWYIIKLNANGNMQWNKTLGSDGTENANCIIQTSDGGYVIVGEMQGFGAGETDMYILKLNANGIKQWNKTIGTSEFENFNSVIQTSDNGLIATGYYHNNILLIKFNINGEILWIKKITDQSFNASAHCIIKTTDNGYAIAGTISSRNGDAYVVKFNSDGFIQWSRAIGGNGWDFASSITQTLDGGLVLGGRLNIDLNDYGLYIVKFDINGNLVWNKVIEINDQDGISSISKTSDGGFIVNKLTYSDMYLMKFNNNSSIQWCKTIGGTNIDFSISAIQTSDGGFAAAGYTQSFNSGSIYIVKLNGNGNTCGNTTTPIINITSGGTLVQTNPIITTANPIITNPVIRDSSRGYMTQICYIGIQPISNDLPEKYSLFQNYPNPFNPVTKIKFEIPEASITKLILFDKTGRKLESLVDEELTAGIYEINWDAGKYSSGVYFYQLSAVSGTKEFNQTKRMVLVK